MMNCASTILFSLEEKRTKHKSANNSTGDVSLRNEFKSSNAHIQKNCDYFISRSFVLHINMLWSKFHPFWRLTYRWPKYDISYLGKETIYSSNTQVRIYKYYCKDFRLRGNYKGCHDALNDLEIRCFPVK